MYDDKAWKEAESFGTKVGTAVGVPLALVGAGGFALLGFIVVGSTACGLHRFVNWLSK
jgi:hypothetical protein